jgi:hypothetical protein
MAIQYVQQNLQTKLTIILYKYFKYNQSLIITFNINIIFLQLNTKIYNYKTFYLMLIFCMHHVWIYK